MIYRLLLVLFTAVSLCSITATTKAATLETYSQWGGTTSISSFGETNTATYGQTFTATADMGSLSSFTFYINDSVDPDYVDFKGYVASWDGTKATTILFTSASMSTSNNGGSDGFETITVSTGGVSLTAGQQYVVFLCASDDFDGVNGTSVWGRVDDSAYTDGTFVYLNNGSDFSLLSTATWSTWGGDLAFILEYLEALQGPDSDFIALHTAVPLVALESVSAFHKRASNRLVHLRTAGSAAYARTNPLAGVQLAYNGDVQNLMRTSVAEKNKHFWGEFYGMTGKIDGDDSLSGYDYNTGGLVLGGDFRTPQDIYLGAFAGIGSSRGQTDVEDDFSAENYQLGVYGTYAQESYYLDGVLSYTKGDFNSKRATTSGTARGDYQGDEFGASVKLGYIFAKDKITFEPFVGSDYVHISQEHFSETGAGSLNMAVDGRDFDSWKVLGGYRLSATFQPKKDSIFVADFKCAFKHELADDNDVVTTNFVDSPAASDFVVEGIEVSRSSIELGTGLRLLQKNNVDMNIDLATNLSGDQQSYSAGIGMQYSW